MAGSCENRQKLFFEAQMSIERLPNSAEFT